MSAAAIPKPSELRPPFNGGPPIRTGFDGRPPDDGDENSRKLWENVTRLLGTVDHTPPDRLELLLRLLEQRRRWIETDLSMERLLSPDTLPPWDIFSLEYLFDGDSKEEIRLVRLLDMLDDAIRSIKNKLRMINFCTAPSDL